MAWDEYHEAILQRVYSIQQEIRDLTQREALSYAYVLSREMPEEAARMLLAELLLDYWERCGIVGVQSPEASSEHSSKS